MILADQHRFDASRAELNAKNGLSAMNCLLGIVSIHVHLSGLEVISANLECRVWRGFQKQKRGYYIAGV
jgi:hypothetical protein